MIVLVVGGTRSGKSELAESVGTRLGEPVTVVVPTRPTDDPDLARRVQAHRDRRPAAWTTIECGPDLPSALTDVAGTALIDSLGTWVAGAPEFRVDVPALLDALTTRPGPTVVVTEEVGLAVHPSTEAGRRFADALGAVNIAVAGLADRVLLTVAGRVTTLDPADRAVADL